MAKTIELSFPRFQSQWDENRPDFAQVFTEPSQTIPDQSLTIPQIISKFTRQGVAPASIRMVDKGGNVAPEDWADPLDDFTEVERIAAQLRKEEASQTLEASDSATHDPAPADAGA